MDAEEGSPQGRVYGVFWRHEAATGYEQIPQQPLNPHATCKSPGYTWSC